MYITLLFLGGIMEEIKESVNNSHKKLIIGAISFCCILILIYFGIAAYFINHYYWGTEINGINASGKSVKEVKEQMESELQMYRLTIKERDGKSEQITANEIGLKYEQEEIFYNLKDEQNAFKWVSSLFNKEDYKITVKTTYDRELLKKRVDSLDCFDINSTVEPKNPSFKYEGSSYVIVDEVKGNKVDKDILYKHSENAIAKLETSVDLEAIDCYEKPQYTSKSQKIIEVKDILNKYVSSKITYTFGESKETLDGVTINTWLTVDGNFVVTFAEERVKDFVDSLAEKYNTFGKLQTFVTSSGKKIKINNGDYGWAINRTKETEVLIAAIKEGKTLVKEPAYKQTAISHDNSGIGNTYVEVDMANQHVWFYKNGKLIIDGPTVTGNVSGGHTTPEGIYSLKYKIINTVLRGPGYAAPVSFWMPFNGGIGLHDASWRDSFGGNIYKTNGSHGCINLQYNVAKGIYNNIQAGTPVICHNNR